MSSWLSSDAFDVSATPTAAEIQAGQTLLGSCSSYSVLEFIGEGCFGKVAKCQNLDTEETVAVKILKTDPEFVQNTEKELSILKLISVLNPDECNVVKFFESFEHMGQTCLAFEMLDRNLYDLLQERDFSPLYTDEIRPIATQLLVALDALKGLGVLHADIKPDNVMVASAQDWSLRVKLIDFGEAVPASRVQLGLQLQPGGYRAPEVSLGLPITEAVDTWGVGCTLAYLYLADNLFPVSCDYHMMKSIVQVLGQPEDHLLCDAGYTRYYFTEEQASDGARWRLMTPEEYSAANNMITEEEERFFELPSCLDDLVDMYPKEDVAEYEERKVFLELLKQLLLLDGEQRISPREALQHRFISASHLSTQPSDKASPSSCPRGEQIANEGAVLISSHVSSSPMSSRSLRVGPEEDSARIVSADSESVLSAEHQHCGTKEDPPASSSPDGAIHDEELCDEDPSASFSDGVSATDIVISSVHSEKLLKRIKGFFNRLKASLGCCWRPAAED